jgi:cytochrome c
METFVMRHPLLSVALAVGLSAIGTAASAQYLQVWSLSDAARAAGKQLFADHCAACHVPQPGAAPLAPSLVGIVGRPAGAQPGFPYSQALKRSGIVWTEDNLRRFIADSSHMVPGTLMPHVQLSDPAEQVYIIEYLKTLRAPARR